MKQITFSKDNDANFGDVKGIVRIDGKILYFQFNNHQVAQNMMSQMQAKGAIITTGRKWIRVNMFGQLTDVKIGNYEFDVSKTSSGEVEEILKNFYMEKYIEAGFKCEQGEVTDED